MEQKLQEDDSIDAVIRRYADTVYRLAFARIGTKHDADDVFQEVFLRYVKNKNVFESEEHRKAWLIRVTINCSNNFLGSIWRKRKKELADDIFFEHEESRNLNRELQKLPLKYREVIHLFYYEDMTCEEIGRALNRKNSTVRAQLTRARAMLKGFMKEEDYV